MDAQMEVYKKLVDEALLCEKPQNRKDKYAVAVKQKVFKKGYTLEKRCSLYCDRKEN